MMESMWRIKLMRIRRKKLNHNSKNFENGKKLEDNKIKMYIK